MGSTTVQRVFPLSKITVKAKSDSAEFIFRLEPESVEIAA
jgi:hypothetical protein